MVNIEKETSYLLKSIPELDSSWVEEYTKDTYLPPSVDHPQIRLRQRGESKFITKKYPKVPGDLSTMIEETIDLKGFEYEYFEKNLPGKVLEKNRYSKNFDGYLIEIDEYLGDLNPLIVMDIEWENESFEVDLSSFDIIKEITQVNELAAGKLAGNNYENIKKHL